jgi:hypothetical protein
VPPDVTVGREEVEVGADDPFELLDELPLSLEDEPEPAVVVVVVSEVEPKPEPELPVLELPLFVLLEVEPVVPDSLGGLVEPGCSSATTTPMTAVSPAAARTAPRVRRCTLDCAFARVSGVLGSLGSAMGSGPLLSERPTSHHARIDPDAWPAVGLL